MEADAWSLQFVRSMTGWAAAIAATTAVAGGLLTHDWRFTLACFVGAAFDVGSLALLLRLSPVRSQEDALKSSRLMAMLVGPRLAIKGVLLALAALLPALLNLWGMLAGVLAFDVTVMTVGTVKAGSSVGRPF